MSGGVDVFDARQFVLVVVVWQSVAKFVEGKGGLELPTNTSSKTSADAACLTVILATDDPVECLHRVGATVALAMQANAASALYRGQALDADVLIVDPSRKGLGEIVLQQLSQKINTKQMYAEKPTLISHLPKHTINWTNDVRTVVYVSCGFDALARDLDVLLSSNGGWKLESATGYVLFPGSNHVETVVVLRR